MTDMTPSEVMWKAAKQAEAGWCRNWLQDDQGNVCALGAINKVVFGHAYMVEWWSEPKDNLRTECREALQEQLKMHGMPSLVPTWNNAMDRTQEEVVTMMQKTAIALEEQGR